MKYEEIIPNSIKYNSSLNVNILISVITLRSIASEILKHFIVIKFLRRLLGIEDYSI